MTDALDIDTSPDNAAAEDLALLLKLRNGEDAAFGELFSRHSDAVRRLALGLAADRAEADDLTAEAFFRVLQAIRRGAGPVDNVRGYLLIVARRVAWEWNGRRRDVPVSDEELNHRVGADPDRSGQSTERNLITRAFTSLPERWRSVLWEVEVEGARPAVVAGNFGLSPNATAALARRARQGLRAAYLQAHLSIDRGSTGCRSVLEKLGAYTAGTIKGVERRKVRVHIATCASCSAMVDELQDVCSGLRAHAAFLAAPVAGVVLWQHMGVVTATGIKGVLANVKIQAALAATSAAAVGAFGYAMVAMGGSATTAAYDDFDAKVPEVVITDVTRNTPTPTGRAADPTAKAPDTTAKKKPAEQVRPQGPATRSGTVANAGLAPGRVADRSGAQATAAQSDGVGAFAAPRVLPAEYDESQPVVFEKTSYERKWAIYDQYDVVEETTTTTRVNAADQTTVITETTQYTVFHTTTPAGDYRIMLSPTPTAEPSESPAATMPAETKPVAPTEEPAQTKPAPAPTESKPAASPTTVVPS
ncbi:putative membrane protein [Alloactinosynnema sp. L-07]|uniref:sigma-70 family RNA polymerase sigma factor n=1 Tax=Alloactinosynnema sp. L-07 TaxID=1653480 RepID=UPI00065EF87C|nr:sigma-70 family RNA polymerase sigma factor [Alloactinosynnema sp. L-07]CRK60799.1 putative membrane protein [Alloactinosynnema sp. L-07]